MQDEPNPLDLGAAYAEVEKQIVEMRDLHAQLEQLLREVAEYLLKLENHQQMLRLASV